MTRLVVSEADAGDFANGRIAWDVLRSAGAHDGGLPEEIDLSGTRMLRPYAVACLAAMGAAAGRQARLVLPTDTRCREHLIRMGLPSWFSGHSEEHVGRATNIVVEQVQDRSESDFAGRVIEVLTEELGLSVGLASDLANHLDEVVLNALTHSDSTIGCVVAGQAFPQTRQVEIAIVDFGQTIRGHLSGNARYGSIVDDNTAIESATREGVTGTVGTNRWGEPNSGVGLYELRRFCEGPGHGELTIASGNAYLCFRGEPPCRFRLYARFGGTLVNFRVVAG